MSKFFSKKYENLTPYTPGEQPKDNEYLKLNTNESPFTVSPSVIEAINEQGKKLHLYSDPENLNLRKKLAEVYKVDLEQIIVTNGSDDVLNFAFAAFCDKDNPIVFPDITYGFYPVFAKFNHVPYTEIPLKNDFTIDIKDYIGINKNIVIANPNAPTGIYLELNEIEEIVKSNPNNVVIIDEAYIDFGSFSAIKLINKYDNLLITRTFSKSRSMAGARLGFAIGNKDLIADLNTIKYSTNPYNVNRMTEYAGIAALNDNFYYMDNCKIIGYIRKYTVEELNKLGFEVLPSKANFVFAKSPKISGEKLYKALKEKGILVRHFSKERIKDYIRITIGIKPQMMTFINILKEILNEN